MSEYPPAPPPEREATGAWRSALIIPMVGFAMPVSVYPFVASFSFIQHEIPGGRRAPRQRPILDVLPHHPAMSVNTIVTVAFVNAVFIWNVFVFANTFIFSSQHKTIPLGPQGFIGAMGATDWTATFAALSITLVPLLVFLILNHAIIYGLEAGAAKG